MIRVAFKILLADRAKYLALVLGIAFSTLLISQQAAIFHSVMTSSIQSIRMATAADIWVTKPNVEILDFSDPMPELYVNRVRSSPGVAWAVPYYQATATMRTGQGQLKPVFLVGVDDLSMVAAPVNHMVQGRVEDLLRPNAVIMDLPGFLRDFPEQTPKPGLVVEIGRCRAEVVGFCKVPPNWSGMTIVYTRRSNAVSMARETINPVSAILAKAAPGQSAEGFVRGRVRQRLELNFIRIEPQVKAKQSLSGATTERVDTRVLVVLYEIASSPRPVYVGQQVDVFIATNETQPTPPHESEPNETTPAHSRTPASLAMQNGQAP